MSDTDRNARKTTAPADRDPPVAVGPAGRPESETSGGGQTYGEPKGPRPPRFVVRPKAEIEAPPAARTEPASADERPPRSETAESDRDGFVSGMTTTETRETAGQHPKTVRRDLETFRKAHDDDADPGRTPRG